jgi:N6-adenosine-specific RNA methylase IME4
MPEKVEESRHAERYYETLEFAQLAEMPVASLAAADCSLFLWATGPMLAHALTLFPCWGFAYKTIAFTWVKTPNQLDLFQQNGRMGMGYWTRSSSEICLLGTRGRPKRLNADVRQEILEPRREHSRKPSCVHERIERLVAGPYLELFARDSSRPGWAYWGNETDKFK